MYSEFMTLLDRLCKSEVAKYGAQTDDKRYPNQQAAKLYHKLADIRDMVQRALPDGVYADLDKVVREFKEEKL